MIWSVSGSRLFDPPEAILSPSQSFVRRKPGNPSSRPGFLCATAAAGVKAQRLLVFRSYSVFPAAAFMPAKPVLFLLVGTRSCFLCYSQFRLLNPLHSLTELHSTQPTHSTQPSSPNPNSLHSPNPNSLNQPNPLTPTTHSTPLNSTQLTQPSQLTQPTPSPPPQPLAAKAGGSSLSFARGLSERSVLVLPFTHIETSRRRALHDARISK
jgi:hypothetical protein